MKKTSKDLFVALLLTLPAVTQAQFTYITNNGAITITGYTGSGGNVTIPATINGLSVTVIGYEAFAWSDALHYVTIPSSVINIGDLAFYNDYSLTNIIIGNGVDSIGNEAFAECWDMTSVMIPNGVTSIGDGAFADDVRMVGVTIGYGVTNLGDSVFIGCDSLTAINVDAANLFYSDMDGVLFNKTRTTLIEYPIGNGVPDYTIPGGVTNIGAYAFAWCGGLSSVTIPNSVTSSPLKNGAFPNTHG
jgi:BspA type Leucine rich repeat region (6 copies)